MPESPYDPFNLIVPVGTQIVTLLETKPPPDGTPRQAGAVGVILSAPLDSQHAYRVRFPDGSEAALSRAQFAILKHYQQGDLSQAPLRTGDAIDRYREYVIYRCVVGSRAYGLDDESSDVDRRGIFLPPADLHWSLYGMPEQIESPATEEAYWELHKFLTLALKANPNILECLYTPLVEEATPLAHELLDLRNIFPSKLIYQSYGGYVMSQFKKLEQDIRTGGAVRWKHAMHLIRLLLSGITALREGYNPVAVGEQRERLLAIRRGQMPWEEVNAWRLILHEEFDTAFTVTRLPERPDYERANAFLIHARRSRL